MFFSVFDVSSSATARRIPSLKTSPIRQKRRNRIRHPPSDRRKKNFFEFLPFSSFVKKNTFMFFPSLKSEIILDLWKNWKWHFNDKVSKKSCSLCSPLAKFWFTDTRVSYSRTKSRRNISMTFTIVKYSLNCLLKRSFGEMVTKAHPWQKM